MATVYLAHDLRHDRRVALKVLRPELAAVIGAERFLAEIRTTANLQHPHILPLHDSGEADRFLYYVMPFVEGESLRERLTREKQLPIPEAVRIATEVASALDYAHRRGIIHRDIKPENILLHDGQALVADFGIALAASGAGGRMTETGMSLGTPHYMSPEQAMGERELGPRSDIYALGALTYEMLVGDPPFTGSTAQAIVAKVMTEKPMPPSRSRDTVPESVEDAVLTALQKLPADRFASAATFADALAGRVPTVSSGRQARPRASGPIRSALPGPLTALGLTAAAAAGLGATAGWLARAPLPVEGPPFRFVFDADSAIERPAVCCSYQVAVSPDERTVVYLGVQDGVRRVFARPLDALGSRPIPGTEGALEVAFSPDGAWLAFRAPRAEGGTDMELRRVPADGGPATTLALTGRGSGTPYGIVWTDDGIIYSSYAAGALFRVPSTGGTPERIGAADRWYLLISSVPEARALVFNDLHDLVHLLYLGDGTTREIGRGRNPTWAAGRLFTVDAAGGLFAAPFRPRRQAAPGAPITVAGDLADRHRYAVGPRGLLAYDRARGSGTPLAELVDRAGQPQPLALPTEGIAHFDHPAFSPDGRRLALAMSAPPDHPIAVVDLERGTSLRLTFGGYHEHVAWTPDGREVLYVREEREIVAQPADRSGPDRVLASFTDVSIGRVTAGGRWIAFAAAAGGPAGGSSDVLIAPAETLTAALPYQATPADEYAPSLSPDGRWLAWVSNESGRPEVYASTAPVPGARHVISSGGGVEPVWSHDGRTLYYRRLDGTVVAVTMAEGDAPLPRDRRVLFRRDDARQAGTGADFAVHPSGDRFLVLLPELARSQFVVATRPFAQGQSSPPRP